MSPEDISENFGESQLKMVSPELVFKVSYILHVHVYL